MKNPHSKPQKIIKPKKPKEKKLRTRAIEHQVQNVNIEFTQRGQKRRLLRIQRYRKPITIKDINLSKNPDKISFAIITTKYGDRLEVFAYKNNPEMTFISLNGEVFGSTVFEWRKIMSGLFKSGKYLGVLR